MEITLIGLADELDIEDEANKGIKDYAQVFVTKNWSHFREVKRTRGGI